MTQAGSQPVIDQTIGGRHAGSAWEPGCQHQEAGGTSRLHGASQQRFYDELSEHTEPPEAPQPGHDLGTPSNFKQHPRGSRRENTKVLKDEG